MQAKSTTLAFSRLWDLNKATELMLHILFIAHTIITHFTLAWKQQTILKMLALVENRFDHFSENIFHQNKIAEDEEKNNSRYLTAITVIISSVHLSFIITSKVYMINLPPEQKSLLYPVTVPFEMSNTVYYIVYLLQLITTFFEGTTHITSIAICTGFMNILCAEYTVLGKSFRHMGKLGRQRALQCPGTEVALGWTPARHHDYHTQALLRSFVDHHILMINFHKALQSTFAIPILEMFLNCEIMLCTCCFQMFKMYQKGEFEKVSKLLCMFFALLAHEFVYFWFGSRVTEKVQSFCYDVYACDWHERSVSFKRSYRIVLERIKRGVTIQALVLPVNLITFAKVLQIVKG
ncbi:putative odorant receptor 19b [Macrosteles quadrilineatus]|uniref:putative odorant receptor 19b n=1 Tax=Macrosteles quadrilineatus TaxID=74068 RepID=UPI0023E12BD3|nr:putative odorant receptor 19b [Macrosteles quadrilineatus]